MTFLLLFLAACFLAYSNGANDNFEGVALRQSHGRLSNGNFMGHDHNLALS